MTTLQVSDEVSTLKASVRSVVGKIAYAMEHYLSNGDLAQLRRISPEEPYTPALWKMLLTYVPESWTRGPKQEEKESQWAALLQGMAMTTGLHDPNVSLGKALVATGWSELRFVRLMQARKNDLFKEMRRLASFLASKSQTADWSDIAQLLFNQQGEWAEHHRRRIARDYYHALYQQEKDTAN
jgi:CRISPR system Cascade subunit CasB